MNYPIDTVIDSSYKLSTVLYNDHCSGCEGRNQPFTLWICLNEHICRVGGAVVWAKVAEYPWWPAQQFLQSGMELVACQQSVHTTGVNVGVSVDDDTLFYFPRHHYLHFRHRDRMAMNPIDRSHVSLYYLFGDNSTYAYICNKDQRQRHVFPFYNKSREARFYSGKVSSLIMHYIPYRYICFTRILSFIIMDFYTIMIATKYCLCPRIC